jgi:hypothetical protein
MPTFQYFSERIPSETGRYHHVDNGNVYIVNFTPNDATLLAGHKAAIERLVVPFIVRATKFLGPAAYHLNVTGSASATGTAEHNYNLGTQRAYNAAAYAIRAFEEIKRRDATLDRTSLYPSAATIGAEKSKPIADRWGWATRDLIEKNQSFFRGAVFKLKADLQHAPDANVFQIREIYYFKFQKITEEAPALIKKLEDWLSNPIVKSIARDLFAKLIKPMMDALSTAGKAVSHLVTYTIPSKVDYCFEIKDYRDRHAMYRYTGIEHKDSLGLGAFLKFFSGLFAIVKHLITIAKGISHVQNYAEKLERLPDELIDKAALEIEHLASKRYAALFRSIVEKLRNNTLQDFMAVPASDWAPFRFHDDSPGHDVAMLHGAAKRNSVDAGFRSAVHLDFGGHTPNSWSNYKAHAQIISQFSFSKGVFGIGFSTGSLILVKGPFAGDAVVGNGTIVTG